MIKKYIEFINESVIPKEDLIGATVMLIDKRKALYDDDVFKNTNMDIGKLLKIKYVLYLDIYSNKTGKIKPNTKYTLISDDNDFFYNVNNFDLDIMKPRNQKFTEEDPYGEEEWE